MKFYTLFISTSLVALSCVLTTLPEPRKSKSTTVKAKIKKHPNKAISTQETIARTIYGLAAAEFAMLSVSVLSLAIGDLLKDKQNKEAEQSSLFDKPFYWWWLAHSIAWRPVRNVLKGDIFEAGILLGSGYITYRVAKFFAYKALTNNVEPEQDDLEAEYY